MIKIGGLDLTIQSLSPTSNEMKKNAQPTPSKGR